MSATEQPPLSFALLDRQIQALPEGPIASLRSPRWTRQWTVVGVAGMILGLLPALFVQWMEPRVWMLTVSRLGLALMIVGLAPGFFRDLWVIAHELRHHRRGFVTQFDHDVAQFRALAAWLSVYPLDSLQTLARYARMGHERLESRLQLMLGGIERLGLLPLLLSLFVVLRNWRDLLALPAWLALLAIMAAILWIIGWMGAEFRRRLQLYGFLLEEALQVKRGRLIEPADHPAHS